MPKALSARAFVALITVLGFLLVGNAVLNAHSFARAQFIALLAMAAVAGRLKVKLPGITGTMSVNLPFILLAAALMGMAEAVLVGFISTFAQCLPQGRQKLNLAQLVFSCSAITLAVTAARLIYVSPAIMQSVASPTLRLALAAAGYFLVNTAIVALIVSLTEEIKVIAVWKEMFQLSFVYLVASSGVACVTLTLGQEIGWQVPLALLPIMAGVFFSFRRYFAAAVAAESHQVETASIPVEAQV
jgi:hypothetical protein